MKRPGRTAAEASISLGKKRTHAGDTLSPACNALPVPHNSG